MFANAALKIATNDDSLIGKRKFDELLEINFLLFRGGEENPAVPVRVG